MEASERALLKQEILEHVYTRIPQMVLAFINERETLRELADQFYLDNPDLANHRLAVGVQINELVAEHPDWDVPSQILPEAARLVREQVAAAKAAVTNPTALSSLAQELSNDPPTA